MSIRSFAGLLVLEDIFDDVPTDNPEILNLANLMFNPNIVVSEDDCGTTLGKYETMSYELQGLTELATYEPFTKERLISILSTGKYETYVRHTSTCIAKDGICAKCFKATYPDAPMVSINSRVHIPPEYLVNAEILEGRTSQRVYAPVTTADSYDKHYLFLDGTYKTLGVDYTFVNGLITFTQSLPADMDIVIRFIRISRSPFLVWLAGTYSGALLGMKALISDPLPLRSLLLTSLLDENRLQLVEDVVRAAENIPDTYSAYSASIKDPLEKALYMVVIYSIYSGAQL
jgi:hypothetical protein